jgi:integrase
MASLRAGDVNFNGDVAWLTIREGKTKAARRRIPVVSPEVVAVLRERVSVDALRPMFPEFEADDYGKVSQALSKRLGRLLRKSVKDTGLVAAHGWRHRGRTLVEAAGIMPMTADYFFGHERPGVGLSNYSTPADDQLLAVARAMPLPKAAEARAAIALEAA